MEYIALIAAALAATVAGVKLYAMRKERGGSWHHTGAQMRRYVNGRWEYRDMTQAEADEWKDMTAW